jgi:hypothetical protein
MFEEAVVVVEDVEGAMGRVLFFYLYNYKLTLVKASV